MCFAILSHYPQPNDVGYVYTTLTDDFGDVKVISVHSVIMSAAIESEPSFWLSKNLEIDHCDRNKANNRFSNLHLCTKKMNHENIDHVAKGKSKNLTTKEVLFIKEAFKMWQGRKIEFYKLMQAEFDLKCWQTIQYNILGYSNKGVK
ncbi:HNH endonuclease [Peribacillus simplex]|uniref:HNH endonuclease n=1 Tax=Peribacillus simplex TaxID=1478 RepID=UPI003CF97D10